MVDDIETQRLHHAWYLFICALESCEAVFTLVTLDEKTEIRFEVYVNTTTVSLLNTGEELIEDILILHLVGGEFF